MSQDRLKASISRRAYLKGQQTRFSKFLDSITDNSDTRIQEIPNRVEKLNTWFAEFEEIQYEIEQLDIENFQLHDEFREQFENKHYSLQVRANKLSQSNTSPAHNPSTSTSNASQTQDQQFNVRLPQLSLPEFSGSYDKWSTFHDTFRSLIDNNLNLSNIQKFYYLQSCLKGEAAQVIHSLEITDINYSVAWTLLKERFENKKRIIKTHLKDIFEANNVTKESHIALRQFLDNFLKNYRALKTLKEPVDTWNTILIYLLLSKLDLNSKREWETVTRNNESPSIHEFINFLTDRCHLLESIDNKGGVTTHVNNHNHKRVYELKSSQVHLSTNNNRVTTKCIFCKGEHYIYRCLDFKRLSAAARFDEIKKLKVCLNCLRKGHSVQECSATHCRTCNKKHHTLLHQDRHAILEGSNSENLRSSVETEPMNANSSSTLDAISSLHVNNNQNLVLLSTAKIHILDSENKFQVCRAILDNGSQSSFITTKLCKKLKLQCNRVNLPITGINAASTNISNITKTSLRSANSSFETKIQFLVIDQITGNVPQCRLDTSILNLLTNLTFADPDFNEPGEIDILLGAGIFYQLLLEGQITVRGTELILQNSKLGWIVSGQVQNAYATQTPVYCNISQTTSLNEQLERFWFVEEISENFARYSKEEVACENHFSENITRNEEGRFVVKLPLRENSDRLCNNREQAIHRFNTVERRLEKQPDIKMQYSKFMKEYIELGHMTPIESETPVTSKTFYLPHHCVLKENSLTTKLRVVFDASAKSSSGFSLNDVLMTGPCIQDDIFSILLRFRTYNVVITADIEKMYRQILVNQNDRDLQRIVWRSDSSKELLHYKLNTVTYGTTSASFLATRCLKQLAIENSKIHPEASLSIERDFYMDDWLTGAEDIETAKTLIYTVDDILMRAGFHLRQWMSNKEQLLDEIAQYSSSTPYMIGDNSQNSKTLGIYWDPKEDCFLYQTELVPQYKISKRIILSIISQIFDPLGLIGPVIIRAKIILQNLWKLNIQWDDTLPLEITNQWLQFFNCINDIKMARIPRHIKLCDSNRMEVHIFCDSSEKAYGACVYLRTENAKGDKLTRLVCAKSKIAPLKIQTIPRLELCAALLAAKLSQRFLESLKLKATKVVFWSDSTIVLSWLRSDPSKFKTFVSNRVSQIQTITADKKWLHVPSELNPADLISRGTTPDQLMGSELWWEGPSFITLGQNSWPVQISCNIKDSPEQRAITLINTSICKNDMIPRFSNFNTLARVTAYLLRFKINCQVAVHERKIGSITRKEYEWSVKTIIKIVQREEFTREIEQLKTSKSVSKNSKLYNLNPFLDQFGIIRVGGRLSNSNLSFERKHPMIIPNKHHVTTLIILHEHARNLHAGCQVVLSNVRNTFWPIGGRNAIRRVLRSCVTCFRVKPRPLIQRMGDLPATRVTPTRAFSVCGVDYAGPYLIKESKLRNRKLLKACICIFVCFVTKAVHIELVSDLTSECFLNAFKRFISRRGICNEIYSDNGTNFVGANHHLKTCIEIAKNSDFQNYLADSKINWHFIPPRSPHFGGLWESAVRSTKHHLKRIMNNIHLTYEEFYTILTQIESILNSRPLYPLTEDPNDPEILTPGHFLIGTSLMALPEPEVSDNRSTYTSRYKHLRLLIQHFWKKWSRDYLNTLQQRTKWCISETPDNLRGRVVILIEDNIPPQQWKLARITELHPGKDNLVRVVSVKTAKNVVKRAINKVCLLPIDSHITENENQQLPNNYMSM